MDDITNEPADETVRFGLDGRSFVIDLTESNAKELRTALAGYIESARVDRGGSPAPTRRARSTPDREQNQAIRAWAQSQGMTVAERGRIPAKITEAFHAAH